MKPVGLFIALEGGEGAGKGTQVDLLVEALRVRGVDVMSTREPGGTPLGAEVRRLLLEAGAGDIAQRAELLLYSADRAQHVEKLIFPALLDGKVVITDRYVGSTMAYQAAGRGLDHDMVHRVCQYATQGLMPGLTFFLDGSPEVLLPRAKGRGDANRFEAEELEFHHSVRQSFRYQSNNPTWHTIDAVRPIEDVHQLILKRVLEECVWYGHVPREDQ